MSRWARAGVSLFAIVLLIVGAVVSLIRPDLPVAELIPNYASEDSQFIEIDGLRVHMRDQGLREGPAVLLLHGTFASLHTWEGWVEVLQDTHRVVTLDLPGFGLTGPHPLNDYSLGTTIQLFETLRNTLEIDQWAVAGNSLGAGYALAYAQHRPSVITQVGLLNGGRIRFSEAEFLAREREIRAQQQATQGTSWIRRAINEPMARALLTQITPKFLIRYALEDVYGQPDQVTERQVRRYQDLLRRKGNREAFVDRFLPNSSTQSKVPPLNPPLPPNELTMPILIMWGERDTWIDVERGLDLAALLPTSTLILYPELGHIPMEEAPQRTAADFLKFLQANEAARVNN